MTDLVKRLRVSSNPENLDPRSLLCRYEIERMQASDRIEALEAEVKRLRADLVERGKA